MFITEQCITKGHIFALLIRKYKLNKCILGVIVCNQITFQFGINLIWLFYIRMEPAVFVDEIHENYIYNTFPCWISLLFKQSLYLLEFSSIFIFFIQNSENYSLKEFILKQPVINAIYIFALIVIILSNTLYMLRKPQNERNRKDNESDLEQSKMKFDNRVLKKNEEMELS